ncbi:MAG TPA: SDR family NAD(P)-dependent oxidoreductase [Polyangiaceae bacterium]|jgi:UDP-glucose 4-epimerase
MDWTGKHVLVTGGAGFIGSHVADAVLARGARVTLYDDFSTGLREFVPRHERARLVEADLLDRKQVDEAMRGVDFVFHLAANADIKDNFKEPRKCVDQNVVVTQNVLESMRVAGVRDIAFSSTGSVYGEPPVPPATPEDAPFPVQTSIYATSKVAAEGLLTSYAQPAPAPAFRVWIFRFVSLLGPRYTHGHVVDFYRKLKADPTRLPVLGNGKQKKSYLHVADCVAAMLVAVDRAREPINVFNLGHTEWLEVDESIRIISRTMGVSPRIEYAGGERGWPGDSPKILLDTARIRALGWAPTKTIEESVVETLRFLMDNRFALRENRQDAK